MQLDYLCTTGSVTLGNILRVRMGTRKKNCVRTYGYLPPFLFME